MSSLSFTLIFVVLRIEPPRNLFFKGLLMEESTNSIWPTTLLLTTKQKIQLRILQKDKCNSPSSISNSTYDVWYQRLGHPTFIVVTQVLSSCNIPFTFNKTSVSMCTDYQMVSHVDCLFILLQLYTQKPLNLMF